MDGYTACTLKAIKGGEALRTDVVEGVFAEAPEKDSYFIMFAKSIDPNGFARRISTSRIQEVTTEGNSITFRTRNSTYKLTILEKEMVA